MKSIMIRLFKAVLFYALLLPFLGFGSKDEVTTTEKYYRMFYAHTYSLVLSLKQIAWYSLSLMEFPLPLLYAMGPKLSAKKLLGEEI